MALVDFRRAGERRATAGLNGVRDLLIELIEEIRQVLVVAVLGDTLRHEPEAVQIQGGLVQHLEIRMIVDEVVEMSREKNVL